MEPFELKTTNYDFRPEDILCTALTTDCHTWLSNVIL